jgi:hypothetical protein
MARFRNGSRYTGGKFTLDTNSKEFLILRNTLVIPESESDIFLTIEGRFKKRIDLVSQKAYGRPDLGWVIADINNIREPLFDLTVGTELRIPPLGSVLSAIEALNKDI